MHTAHIHCYTYTDGTLTGFCSTECSSDFEYRVLKDSQAQNAVVSEQSVVQRVSGEKGVW